MKFEISMKLFPAKYHSISASQFHIMLIFAYSIFHKFHEIEISIPIYIRFDVGYNSLYRLSTLQKSAATLYRTTTSVNYMYINCTMSKSYMSRNINACKPPIFFILRRFRSHKVRYIDAFCSTPVNHMYTILSFSG